MVKRILSKRKKGLGKVRNATPNVLDGIEFKSKLESYTYQKLKENKIVAANKNLLYYKCTEGFYKVNDI
jgi:hypothetical protein